MENTYIVKSDSHKLICFFYLKDEGIAYKVYENNNWSKTEIIFRNALENYTVTLSNDKAIYIFCQDISGNLFVCTNSGGIWRSKTVLENQSKKINKVLFYPIISESGITLIYNVPESESRQAYLVSQSLNDAKWSEPVNIDSYERMQGSIFQVHPVAKDYILLFYLNRSNDLRLGYREVTSSLQGPLNIFHQTAFHIRDQSFLATASEIHFLYIVKTFFSSQLIYRKKSDDGFSKPKVLYEAQRISKCLMFIIKNKLYIHFISNSQLMEIISADCGDSFEKARESRTKFSPESEKAFFISSQSLEDCEYYLREVFVDSEQPWDIQIIPSLINDFYPVELKTADIQEKQKDSNNEQKYIETINEYKEYLNKMKNQFAMAKKLLDDKDRQIINLTASIQEKNVEMAMLRQELAMYKKQENNYSENVEAKAEQNNPPSELEDNFDFEI